MFRCKEDGQRQRKQQPSNLSSYKPRTVVLCVQRSSACCKPPSKLRCRNTTTQCWHKNIDSQELVSAVKDKAGEYCKPSHISDLPALPQIHTGGQMSYTAWHIQYSLTVLTLQSLASSLVTSPRDSSTLQLLCRRTHPGFTSAWETYTLNLDSGEKDKGTPFSKCKRIH